MKPLVFIPALVLAGCITINDRVAEGDKFLRDKCGYAQAALVIFELGALAGVPGAAPLAITTSEAYDEFCKQKPVTNIIAAKAKLERLIVIARNFNK